MEMDKLEYKKIAIIGRGHMGEALYKGLLNIGLKKENLVVSNSSTTNRAAIQRVNWVIISVKPFDVKNVLESTHNIIEDKIIISAAAGVSSKALKKYTNNNAQKIIRIMPNLYVSINDGVLGVFAGEHIVNSEKKEVINLLEKLGLVIEVKNEADLDIVTLMCGCGPALTSYFVKQISDYGVQNGLSKKESSKIAAKVFASTLKYLDKMNVTSEVVINSVSTRGGITESIINALEDNRVGLKITKSLDIGKARLKALTKSLL